MVLAALAASCGSGGGGGSGTENPTDLPGDNASPGLLLAVDEFRPALHSITNIGQTLHAEITLDPAYRAEGTTFQWRLDGALLPATSEALDLDCSGIAAGTHSLEVTVSSGGLSSAFYWSVQLGQDSIKNRAPMLLQALPAGVPAVARGETVRFVAVAEDVDAADSLQYAWSVDSKDRGVDGPVLEVDTSILPPGTHQVAVALSDGNEHLGEGASRHEWTLRVGESSDGALPFISGAWPAGHPRMDPRGSLRLEVAVAGTSDAPPACRWDVDGVLQPTSEAHFDFNPSAAETGVLRGTHQVSCTLASGDDSGLASAPRVSWTITLGPPEPGSPAGEAEENRLPVVTELSPADSSGLPQADSMTFRVDAVDGDGDVLTYRWLVDGAPVEGAGPAHTLSANPELGQVHSTIEVLSSDGRSSAESPEWPNWYSLAKWSLAAIPLEGAPLTLSTSALILDDGQSGTTLKGTWRTSGATQPYGANSLYSVSAGDTYQYNLKVPAAGSYDVLLWWTAWPNRSSAVPVTITYGGGSSKVTVNQLTNGGKWNFLGTFQFSSSAKITITAAPGGYSTCADAVCLNPRASLPPDPATLDPAPGGAEFTIDDGSPGTSSEGHWAVSSGKNPYGGRSLYAGSTGAYSFFRPLSVAGTYDVHVWWTSVYTRDSQAPYEIAHAGGTATVARDQRTGGGQWQYLGRYDFTANVRVTVRGRGAGTVCADAARFVPAPDSTPDPSEPDPGSPLPEVTMDDGTPGTSSQGYWPVSSAKNAYGGRSLYNGATGSYSYTCAFPVPATYDVYAWWTSAHTRDSQAPYEIVHAQGTTTVTKDQKSGGGQWQLLGRYAFAAEARVTVRGRGAGTVCADAVRFVWAPVLPPEPESVPEIEVTPPSLAFGDVVVGSSRTLSFTVRNVGTAALQISSIALRVGTGPEFAIVSGAATSQLPPRASTAVSVSYSPQAAASSAGAAIVKSNDTDEPSVTVSLTGRGLPGSPAPAPEVDVSPISLSFGEVIPGGSSTRSVTVRNLGTATLSVSSIGLGAGTDAAFTITGGPSSASISPGQSISITLRYAPSAEGTDQGSLVVRSSDADEPQVAVALAGSCAAPDPTGRSVTLAWDPPTTNADGTPLTDLKGFRVYWGTSSRTYSWSGDAQGSTQFTTPVLAPGKYYFAVAAYDLAGNESVKSGEIFTVVP